MLRLPTTAPRWLDLAHGVRVFHRPATPAEMAASAAWAKARSMEAESALRERLGVEPADGERTAAWAGFLTVALARLCVTQWEGVDADCTPDNVEALMQVHGMAEAYLPDALSVVRAIEAEGNAYAPAQSGITAGALNTATDAEPQG